MDSRHVPVGKTEDHEEEENDDEEDWLFGTACEKGWVCALHERESEGLRQSAESSKESTPVEDTGEGSNRSFDDLIERGYCRIWASDTTGTTPSISTVARIVNHLWSCLANCSGGGLRKLDGRWIVAS
jgi:hypothetical protein